MERVTLDFPVEATIHRHPLSVRITDMNYGRHLAHDTLVSLLHEARSHAFAALDMPEWDMHGYPSVVADLAVQYHREARWPEALEIDTAVPAPEGKAMVIFQRIRQASTDQVIATVRITQLLLDIQSGRPVSIPGAVIEVLAQARGN